MYFILVSKYVIYNKVSVEIQLIQLMRRHFIQMFRKDKYSNFNSFQEHMKIEVNCFKNFKSHSISISTDWLHSLSSVFNVSFQNHQYEWKVLYKSFYLSRFHSFILFNSFKWNIFINWLIKTLFNDYSISIDFKKIIQK